MLAKWVDSFAAGAALLLASLLNYLIFNDYPLFRADVGLVAAAVVIFCAGMAIIYGLMCRVVRAVMEGLFIGLIIDLNSKQAVIAFVVGAGLIIILFAAQRSIMRIAAIVGTFVIATSLIGFSARKPWIETEMGKPGLASTSVDHRPAIVHVILDEHIGIEGIPQNTPEGVKLKHDLLHYYKSRSFALFGRAYSQHMHTVNAIPFILNYGERFGREGGKDGARIGPTHHFENLRKAGYRLHIMQSDYLDYCKSATVFSCTTYNSASLLPTLNLPMSTIERARLIIDKFIALTSWAKRFEWSFKMERRSLTSSVAAQLAFREFTKQVRSARPGDVFFAHILLPHYPYVLDKNCRFLPQSGWLHRQHQGVQTQLAYFAQVRCVTSDLDRVLDALKKSPAGANSVVIVHGDHGSRLTTTDPKADNAGAYTQEDLIAGFSTLFAVRGPRTTPGYRLYQVTADSLLRDTVSTEFSAPVKQSGHVPSTVILDDQNWKPTARVAFPSGW